MLTLLTLTSLGFPGMIPFQNGDKKGELQPEVWRQWEIPSSPIRNPAEELATFKVGNGLEVKLVASEPLIEDPVDAIWDGQGRLWVVEMQAFMRNADGIGEVDPICKVGILEDLNGDGVMDHRTDFLTNVPLPRAVCPVPGGALVLVPPNILWCPDANQDGVADKTIRVAEGFEQGLVNVEHAPNAMRWGLDNHLYLAKHGYRYRWDGKTLHKSPANLHGGQWGLTEDDWGRHWFNNNSHPLYHTRVPAGYIERHPGAKRSATGYANPVKSKGVFPGRINPGVNRAYREGVLRSDGRLNRWTGACGPLVFSGFQLGADADGDVFMCEPCGNFIRQFDIQKKGKGFAANNAVAKGEFLTSTDERFRPVNLFNGPDGALYIVDLYRGILQDKMFLTTFLRNQSEERGLDKPGHTGRIWKVVKKDSAPKSSVPKLNKASLKELVSYFESSSKWWRIQAQKELVCRKDLKAQQPLIQLLRNSTNPKAVVSSLWTWNGLKLPYHPCLLKHFSHQDPQVVAQALRATEYLSDVPPLFNAWEHLMLREELEIHQQLALSLGSSPHPRAMDLLVNLANADERTTFFCELIASSVYQKEGLVLPFLNQVELREIILNWQERAASKSPPPKVPSLGAKVFSNFCVACHGGNGEGVPLLAPPFDGSEWLLMEDEVLIKIVLEGLIGPIKVAGKDYNLAMPPLLTLSNEEIAGVLTYIRQQWAPSAKPISADAVAKLRQGL